MKRYNFFYFVKQAFAGMWRNGVMTFASIAVLMSLLVVIGSFSLLVYNIDVNLSNFGVLNQIVVFVDRDASEDEITEIGEKISKLDNIEKIERITKAEGLAEMMKKNDVYSDVSEEDNPLPDKFVITYVDNGKVPELDYQLSQIDGIKKINDRLDLATTIENLKQGIMIVFIWFLVILAIVSVFIIINTIKLSVFARKNEIAIMRYIGATGWFISLPFTLEGIFIGLFSSIIAFFAEWYIYAYAENLVLTDLQMIEIVSFGGVRPIVLLGFIAVGILTGVIGSSISLGKYLKENN